MKAKIARSAPFHHATVAKGSQGVDPPTFHSWGSSFFGFARVWAVQRSTALKSRHRYRRLRATWGEDCGLDLIIGISDPVNGMWAIKSSKALPQVVPPPDLASDPHTRQSLESRSPTRHSFLPAEFRLARRRGTETEPRNE